MVAFANKLGATYYSNEGTFDNPVWVERPTMFRNSHPDGDFAYNNLTLPLFLMYSDYYEPLNQSMGTPFTLYAFNNYTQGIATMRCDAYYPSHYVVGTNPYLRRINFAFTREGTWQTRGYHIVEVWNNENELNNWTLTVEFNDLDKDGKNEVIVGDYDNNLYVFEHMTNNTYKRAFRSFDFNYTLKSTESPYAWEELEGISGTFYRKIWDHVTNLAVGSDLDGDGLKEIIAVTELNVFVFEATGVDDHYTLIWQYDFRNSYWYQKFGTMYNKVPTKITALAYADDLDYNYKGEIIIAIGNLLLIFESDGNNGFVENFMGNTTEGLYDIIGNPFVNYPNNTFENLTINTIAVADTDNDGYFEIILGGTNTTAPCHPPNGFVEIIENHIGTYQKKWLLYAANFFDVSFHGRENVTLRNPVNIIRIDDQDKDGYKEILVGHQYGVDIWEYNATTDKYQLVESISGSTMHPKPRLYYLTYYSVAYGSTDHNFDYPSNDILYSQSQGIFEVFTAKWVDGTVVKYSLFWRRSTDDGNSWSTTANLFTDVDYNSSGTVRNVTLELDPSLLETPNGDVWLAWRAKVGTTSGTYLYAVYISRWTGSSWTAPHRLISTTSEIYERVSIRLFRTTDSSYPIGLAYRFKYDGKIYIRKYTTTLSESYVGSVSYIGDGSSYDYETKYFDIMLLDDGRYFLVFDGRRKSEGKVDYDIWGMYGNATWSWERPIRVAHTIRDEGMPKVTQLTSNDKTIMVSYHVLVGGELRPYVTYSKDGGTTWSDPDELFADVVFLFPICYNGTPRYMYFYGTGYGLVLYMTQMAPAISARPNGGFVYSLMQSILHVSDNGKVPPFGTLHSKMTFTWLFALPFGIRRDVNWTRYETGPVTSLTTGDTDRDGREEIFINYKQYVTAFELQESANDWQTHAQVWFSPKLPHSVTDLSVGDGNGNGWPELQISTERGDVYSYEVTNLNMTLTNLTLVPLRLSSASVGTSTSAPREPILSDFNGDGKLELATMSYNGTGYYVFVYSHELDLLWATSVPDISKLRVVDINHDGVMEIFVGVDNGDYLLLNGTDGSKIWSISTSYGAMTSAVIENTYPERIFVSTMGGHVIAIKLSTGAILWDTDLLSTVYSIGFVINSTAYEIAALRDNGELYLLSPENGTSLRDKLSLTGTKLVTGDLDNDGLSEYTLVGNYYILILDDDFSIIRNMTVPYANGIWVSMIDLNNDGKLEILTYLRNSTLVGGVYLLNHAGVIKWIHTVSNAIYNFGLADLNNDTISEIILPLTSGNVLVVDGVYGGLLEVILHSTLRSYEVVADDSNSDGVPEVFVTSYNNKIMKFGYELFGKTYRADVTTIDYELKLSSVLNGYPVEIIKFYDLTNDGILDILVAGGNTVAGISSNGRELFKKSFVEGTTVYEVKSILVWREINSAVSIAISVDGKGIYSYSYNISTESLTEEWYFKDTTYTAYDLDVYTYSGKLYIAAAMVRGSSAGGVYLLDSDGTKVKERIVGVPIRVIEVHEFSSSHTGLEIVAYTDNNYLYFYDFSSFIEFYTYTAKRVYSFSCEDVNNDGEVDVVIGTDDSVKAISPDAGSELWSYSTNGRVNSVVVAKRLLTSAVNIAAEIDNKEIIILSSSGSKIYTFDAPNLVTSLNTSRRYSTFLYNADITNDGYQDLIAISDNKLYVITLVDTHLDAVWATNLYVENNITALSIGISSSSFALADTEGNVYLYNVSVPVDIPPSFPQYPSGYGDFSAASEEPNGSDTLMLLYYAISILTTVSAGFVAVILAKKRLVKRKFVYP